MPDEAWTPLLFIRVRSRARMLSDARSSRSATEQRIAVERWAERQDRALTMPVLVPRTRAPYRPDRDTWLHEQIQSAKSDGRVLVMDDLFRFVDGCDVQDAQQIMIGLLALEPPIFSIRHGAPLNGVAPSIYRHEIEHRVRSFRSRSERAKRAAAEPENSQVAPSSKARSRAIRVRKHLADEGALRLVEKIDHVRASLAAAERNNLSVVARALNDAEIPTPSGAGRWQGTTVKRVLERAGRLKGA